MSSSAMLRNPLGDDTGEGKESWQFSSDPSDSVAENEHSFVITMMKGLLKGGPTLLTAPFRNKTISDDMQE